MKRKIAILTSGGDAPGMNAAIRGLTRYALSKGIDVYGIMRGYEGLLNQEIIPLTRRSVGEIIHRGGTMLRTARCPSFLHESAQKQAADYLQQSQIDMLFVIGGDGSMRGAAALSRQGIDTMVIPGTIDNDMPGTQYTLGFDTAVNTVLTAVNKIRDTAFSHERVAVIEVMGRNSGFIALEAGLAVGAEMVLIPEYPVDLAGICQQLTASHERKKMSSIIIVAEGAAKGSDVVAYIQQHTQVETNLTVLGYIQRGGSPSSYDAVMAGKLAQCAIDTWLQGNTNCIIGLRDNVIMATPYAKAASIKNPLDKKKYELVHVLGQ